MVQARARELYRAAYFGGDEDCGDHVAISATAVVARTHRAIALMETGDVPGARVDLDRIIEHSPNHWKARTAFTIRAGIRGDQGDYTGAIDDMEQAIARSNGEQRVALVSLLAKVRAKKASDDTPGR
jgi:hypothetical protein